MQNKILIIVHQEQSTPGRVGMLLEERGYDLDTVSYTHLTLPTILLV